MRVTRPRIAVLEELAEHPHSSAEEVRIGVTKRLGSISTQAVYDVLHILTEKNLLRCIEPKGLVPRYELSRNHNHHHLVCRECSQIIDVKCKNPNPPCLDISNPHGFIIDEAEITFWGFARTAERKRIRKAKKMLNKNTVGQLKIAGNTAEYTEKIPLEAVFAAAMPEEAAELLDTLCKYLKTVYPSAEIVLSDLTGAPGRIQLISVAEDLKNTGNETGEKAKYPAAETVSLRKHRDSFSAPAESAW
ncbi:transcriptional repressor [Arcanobacterium hippocoleae]